MNSLLRQTLTKAIALIIRPLIKLWIKKGFSYGAFEEVIRWVFVDVVSHDFHLKGRKQTDSRVAVITGLTRHQVHRYREMNLEQSPENAKSNRSTRVLTGWLANKTYQDSDGNPLVLPVEEGSPSFKSLVKEYAGDVSHQAILDELINLDSVQSPDKKNVTLISRGYIPSEDENAIIEIIGHDAAALISTLEHNLNSEKGHKRFQKKVCYDNIPQEALEKFKNLSGEKAQALLEELNVELSETSVKRKVKDKDYYEIGMGLYYFEKKCR